MMNNEEERKVSVFHRIGNFFSLRDEEETVEGTESPTQPRNVVAFSSVSQPRRGAGEVSVFAPRAFSEVTEIADALRDRKVVIVNLQGVDRGLLQRAIDFTSGVAYTLDGRIQKLAEAIFLIVPPGVAVNAQGIRETLATDGVFEFLQNRG